MQQIGCSYPYNVVCVLLRPVPAAQLHPSVQWAPASAGLRGEQVVLWVEMVSDSQAYLCWDQAVHVPVNCHAMNEPSCMDIIQDLGKLQIKHLRCIQGHNDGLLGCLQVLNSHKNVAFSFFLCKKRPHVELKSPVQQGLCATTDKHLMVSQWASVNFSNNIN